MRVLILITAVCIVFIMYCGMLPKLQYRGLIQG